VDKEAWCIAASTSIGGTLGWLAATLKVADLCSSDAFDGISFDYNECQDSTMITSFVYPSSILTGLVFGLLFGVILAFFISTASKEEATIAVRSETIRCKHWISSEARCPNTHTNSKYCDEHKTTGKSLLFRESSI
jgi:hypothetical protein